MRSLVVLTQSESKRIIAKGLVEHPLVQEALKSGKIFVARGSTNAYFLEELLEESFEKSHYIAGQVTGDKDKLFRYGALNAEKRLPEIILEKGEKKVVKPGEYDVTSFTSNDVIIKGGNVLGSDGIAGVYLAHPAAGTIGTVMPVAVARGIPIISPVSLIKRIELGVWELAQIMGNQTFNPDYVQGLPIGIMPILGEVFTELDALELLYPDLYFGHIGSGGVGKAEGSVHFLMEGEEEKIKSAYTEITNLIRNEGQYQPDLD